MRRLAPGSLRGHHRSMRASRLLAVGILSATWVLAAAALGQPHGKPSRAQPKPKPATSAPPDNPYDDKDKTTAAVPTPLVAPATASIDAGTAPPPSPSEAGDGGRPSPLNPASNEFSDAGAQAP